MNLGKSCAVCQAWPLPPAPNRWERDAREAFHRSHQLIERRGEPTRISLIRQVKAEPVALFWYAVPSQDATVHGFEWGENHPGAAWLIKLLLGLGWIEAAETIPCLEDGPASNHTLRANMVPQ